MDLILQIISLLGGLAIFLFGMNEMSASLERASGARLSSILEKLTHNALSGLLCGFFVTAIIQSSSATTVMVVGFVNAGILSLSGAVFVIMGANRTFNDNGNADYYGNFDEAQELLIYTFGGYKINQLLYPGMSLHQFKVNDGECSVVGTPDVSINAVLPEDAHMKNLIMKYSVVDGGIKAPIDKGEKVASVQLWYGASCMAEVDLFAMSEVRDQDETGVEIYGPTRDDSNIWGLLGIVLLILVGVFGAYLAYNSYRRAVARARRRKKRASRRRSR